MEAEQAARAALTELDRALAEKPHREGATLSAATHHLCIVRDGLARRPADDPVRRRWLGHINAVITVVLAGHFPIGQVPWDELARARAWLADFVFETATA